MEWDKLYEMLLSRDEEMVQYAGCIIAHTFTIGEMGAFIKRRQQPSAIYNYSTMRLREFIPEIGHTHYKLDDRHYLYIGNSLTLFIAEGKEVLIIDNYLDISEERNKKSLNNE